MAEVLGDKRILMMRNHGAMVVGASVGQAYLDVYQLERACMYQLLAVGGGGEMQLIPDEVATAISAGARNDFNSKHFAGMKAFVDARAPDYAN